MKRIVCSAFLLAISCSGPDRTDSTVAEKPVETSQPASHLKRLDKLSLTGDFNGDGKTDTLFQHNLNTETGLSIDSFPDPMKHEWDSVLMYFTRNYSRISLSSSMPGVDTLYLGEGMGLYCLINIGDVNRDGKDEIALVIDKTDYTRVNYCEIYSVCKGKWVEMKAFSVHEGAFDFTDSVPAIADRIDGFLEKKKGKWVYLDYIDDLQSSDDQTIGILQPLRLGLCK